MSSSAVPALPVHLADVFDAVSARHADRPMVVFGDRRLTYAEVRREVEALAAALADLGTVPGARVAVNLPNWPEWLTTALATARLGATLVPVNPGLGFHEMKYQLRHAEATVVVTAETWEGHDFLEVFEELAGDLPGPARRRTVGAQERWTDRRIGSVRRPPGAWRAPRAPPWRRHGEGEAYPRGSCTPPGRWGSRRACG